jgi:hypothetical protein
MRDPRAEAMSLLSLAQEGPSGCLVLPRTQPTMMRLREPTGFSASRNEVDLSGLIV